MSAQEAGEQDFALARVSTGAEAVERRPEVVGQSGLVAVEQARAVQEVQAKLIIAKKFPRNETQAIVDITQACKRASLAKVALYSYERGKTKIQAPSIRLAEVLARAWGNVDFGIRELTQGEGYSDVESYAWDLQTNVTALRSFKVTHRRFTKQGSYDLEDPRDIYETVANNGARRMRACILEIIPGDIVEDAVNQVKETLRQAGRAEGPIEDRIKKMALAFNGLGVSVEAVEARLGHKVDLTTEDELIDLLGIYNSIKDGVKKRTDFFSIQGGTPTAFSEAKQSQPPAPPPVAKPQEKKAKQPAAKTEGKDPEEPPVPIVGAPAEAQPPAGNKTLTPEQMKANLQKDPFACPKTGEPLGKVNCDGCSDIATCQAMSGEANPPPAQEAAAPPAPPPPPEPPKAGRGRPVKNKDANLVCGYAKMEALYGRSVYMKYCQESCKLRAECPTLKEHGGPTK